MAKFFSENKRDLSDQSKEQTQDHPKKVREKSEGSCSVNDSNFFDEGLDKSYCSNILYNYFKKLETRVTEIFDLANATNEN